MATELIYAMYPALTGRRHTDADTPLTGLLAELVALAGSGAAAARILGISPTTLYRWRSGRQAPKTGRDVLARAVRRAALTPAMEKAVRSKTRTMHITGIVRVSNDARLRTVNVGRHIPAGTTGRILSLWLAADDEKADRMAWRAIDRHYVEDMEIDEFEGVVFK